MSKILDGKIHAMNSEWAYIGIEYIADVPETVIFMDIIGMMEEYSNYAGSKNYIIDEFSIAKYPKYILEGEIQRSFLLMQFKRLPGDNLDE